MSTDAEIAKRCNEEPAGAFRARTAKRTAMGWALMFLFSLATLGAAIIAAVNS